MRVFTSGSIDTGSPPPLFDLLQGTWNVFWLRSLEVQVPESWDFRKLRSLKAGISESREGADPLKVEPSESCDFEGRTRVFTSESSPAPLSDLLQGTWNVSEHRFLEAEIYLDKTVFSSRNLRTLTYLQTQSSSTSSVFKLRVLQTEMASSWYSFKSKSLQISAPSNLDLSKLRSLQINNSPHWDSSIGMFPDRYFPFESNIIQSDISSVWDFFNLRTPGAETSSTQCFVRLMSIQMYTSPTWDIFRLIAIHVGTVSKW